MAKTSKQIQGDIYNLLRSSDLARELTGGVYRAGMRPRDSRNEDAVVIFTAGFADQIQSGVVTINIFVPDIDPFRNGVFVEDGRRVEQLERLAGDWVDSLTTAVSGYRFELQRTIATFKEEEPINQHFISVKLRYDFFGDDNERVNI